MTERNVNVATSLEVRQVALLVQAAGKFVSGITVKIDNKSVNAKSMMGMISLGITEGQVITLAADGPDEVAALNELECFFN